MKKKFILNYLLVSQLMAFLFFYLFVTDEDDDKVYT